MLGVTQDYIDDSRVTHKVSIHVTPTMTIFSSYLPSLSMDSLYDSLQRYRYNHNYRRGEDTTDNDDESVQSVEIEFLQPTPRNIFTNYYYTNTTTTTTETSTLFPSSARSLCRGSYFTFEKQEKEEASTTSLQDDDSSMLDEEGPDERLKEALLEKASKLAFPHDAQQGYRATEIRLWNFQRPHMRTFHASWICFFCGWFIWFSMAPLLPHIQDSTGITVAQIWTSNIFAMIGTIVLRFLLGPMCDKYGARGILTVSLAVCAVPLLLAGILVKDYYSLLVVRFWTGCVGGMLVPCQYWITAQFIREVCGKAMAICAGWGAMGGGAAQVLMGALVFPKLQSYFNDDDDLAWRVALVVPASLALVVAYFFYYNADDCPLGNLSELHRAGLIQERSAVDSFRSGIVNLNAWILFLQFGAGLGIELAFQSSATLHLSDRFDLELHQAAAYASLFGLMNIFSRGLGGILSDNFHKYYSLRGRLSIHMVFMIIEAIFIICFIRCSDLKPTLVFMVLFAIFGQVSTSNRLFITFALMESHTKTIILNLFIFW